MRVSGFGWLLYVLQNRMNKKALIRTISRELDTPVPQDRIALILDKAVEISVCCTTSLTEEYFLEQLALNY